jgi:hypothetical protein
MKTISTTVCTNIKTAVIEQIFIQFNNNDPQENVSVKFSSCLRETLWTKTLHEDNSL